MNKVLYPVRFLPVDMGKKLGIKEFPNFSKTGSVKGMRKLYGKHCMLVKCGNYIYNVQTFPEIYHMAHTL